MLADLYRDDERYAEAVQTLDKLIAQVGPATAATWRLYYLRGAALEREGKTGRRPRPTCSTPWSLKPDDPEVLNYLGFAWADRGEHLDDAVNLLTKANHAWLPTLGPSSTPWDGPITASTTIRWR